VDEPSPIPPRIEIISASPEQEPILANLLQLYAHDFSGFYDVELEANGRFIYKDLPLYWREASRHPFLVYVDHKLAGFVLMKRGSEVSGNPNVWDMVEFFVARGYRRRGIGTEIAKQIWTRYPGFWELRVLRLNQAARRFWSRAIKTFAGIAVKPLSFQKDGDDWLLYSFESKENIATEG
jgi:predicted acetyltransferase